MPNAPLPRQRADTRTDALRLVRTAGRGQATGSRRWELEAATGGDRARCGAFLDRLESMTRAEWLDLGRRAAAFASDPSRLAAAAALRAALDARRLGVTAWLVRDAVETAVQTAPPTSAPATRAEAALLAAARQAAALAALSLLARPWLPRTQLAALLTPFLAVTNA